MQTDMEMIKEEQDQEVEVLKSIYEGDDRLFLQKESVAPEGRFLAELELPQPFHICLKNTEEKQTASEEGPDNELIQVTYLPPITLDFMFSMTYPAEQSPVYNLSCKWLTSQQLSRLCERLDEIWEENKGSPIMFHWFQFLQNEAVDYLQITSPLILASLVNKASVDKTDGVMKENISSKTSDASIAEEKSLESNVCQSDSDSAIPPKESDVEGKTENVSVDLLLRLIRNFNKKKEEEDFNRSYVECTVCLTENIGSQCMRFNDCHHAFCKTCLRGFFTVQIKDGNVKSLNCPAPDCESQAHPNQVKELVSQEEYTRYEQILLQVTLDTMSDVVYCPRRLCQHPVIKEEDNLGRCPSCKFSFCTLCKQGYHGSSPCRIKSKELRKLRETYLNGTEEEKQFLEKRYGRHAIKQALEECFSADWLEKNAKMCPYCGTQIQKIDGCNKMTCIHCRSYFCWLCDTLLSRTNPYGHFNNNGSPCAGRLFEGVVDEEYWGDDGDMYFYDDEEDDFF